MKLSSLEESTSRPKEYIDSEQGRFEIVQSAQSELIEMAGGEIVAVEWIAANSARYRELIDDPKNNFIERLAHENTREEALREIQKKLAN